MLEHLLRQQAGVVTSRQLTALGYSRGQIMRLTRGWASPLDGLHLAGPATWESALWSALLVGGDDAVLGQEAAAHEWGILDEPGEIVVWVPHRRRGFTVGRWQVRFREGVRKSRRTPALTLVEDTVLDIAHDRGEVAAVAAVTRALADGFTTGQRLLATMEHRSRQRHRRVLVELCSEASAGIESALEYLFQRNVLRPHGLPEPTRQVRRAAGRVDVGYEEYGLLVELDGERYHRDKGHDYHRDNEHVIDRDERTLRYGWRQVNEGACMSAAQLARALARGGWRDVGRGRCQCRQELPRAG